MTVLLAAKEDNKVVLASDRQVNMIWHLMGEATKSFKKRGFFFAGTGNCRDIQVVMNKLQIPPRNEDHNIDSYIFDISESMRSLFLSIDKDKKSMDASFLLVSKEGLWHISSDYSYVHSTTVLVDGSGCDVVLGAYCALLEYENDLEKRCSKAITLTNENTIYCGKGVDLQVIDLTDDGD